VSEEGGAMKGELDLADGPWCMENF